MSSLSLTPITNVGAPFAGAETTTALAPGFDVGSSLLGSLELARGFDDDIDFKLAPRQLPW